MGMDIAKENLRADERLEEWSRRIGNSGWLVALSISEFEEKMDEFKANPRKSPIFSYNKVPGEVEMPSLREMNEIIESIPDNEYGKVQRALGEELKKYREAFLCIGAGDGESSRKFQESTRQLFGGIPRDTLRWAKENYGKETEKEQATVGPEEFRGELLKYLKECGIEGYDVRTSRDISGIWVPFPLFAGKGEKYMLIPGLERSESDLEALKLHEMSHVSQYENGKLNSEKAGILMFGYDFPGKVFAREGLALYNEKKAGFESEYKLKKRAGQIIAMHLSEDNGFRDVYHELLEAGFSPEESFRLTYQAKRGISDTSKKGANFNRLVYQGGLHKVEDYIKNGGNKDLLYTGFVGLDYMDFVRKVDEKMGLVVKYKPKPVSG